MKKISNYLNYAKLVKNFMEDLQNSEVIGQICSVYLKGSLATGEVSDTSDLDLCIVWKDDLVDAGNVGDFLMRIGALIAQYSTEPHFSIPKVMSYAAWKYDIWVNYLDFGQESHYAGKVLYGEEIVKEVADLQPQGERFWGMQLRNLIFRIHLASQEINRAASSKFTSSLDMKHLYRVLRQYLQLTTGNYYMNYQDIVHTFTHFYPEAISAVLHEPFCRKREVTPEVQADLLRQIHLLHGQSVTRIKEQLSQAAENIQITRVGKDCSQISSARVDTAGGQGCPEKQAETADSRSDYLAFVEPVTRIVEESFVTGGMVTVSSLFLDLCIQYRYSYFAFNWVNKLLEYHLGQAQYNLDYIYEYFRLSLLKERHILYCVKNAELLELSRGNPLMDKIADLQSGNFSDLLLLHYALEKEILRDHFAHCPLDGIGQRLAGGSHAL